MAAVSSKAEGGGLSLRQLHQLLRGRYWIGVSLGILLAIAGGIFGWRFAKPAYRAEALLQVRYAQPGVDPGAVQGGTAPFDVFMHSQQTLITSRSVVERALTDPKWQAVGASAVKIDPARFAGQLLVEVRANSEFLQIAFTDEDPIVAATAVRAIVNAYCEAFTRDERYVESTRLKVNKQTRDELVQKLAAAQKEIGAFVAEYGSADLLPLHDTVMARQTRLQMALDDIQMALAQSDQKVGTSPAPTTQPSPAQANLDPEAIALVDPAMRSLLDQKQRAKEQLEDLASRFGQAYPDVVNMRRSLQRAMDRVEQYANEFRMLQRAGRRNTGDTNVMTGVETRSPAELRAEAARLTPWLEKARQEMVKLEQARLRLEQLADESRRVRQRLETVNRNIELLQDQDQMGDRVAVKSAGAVPLRPSRDLRAKLAAGGAMGGFSLPVAVLVLIGFLQQRYRYSDDTVSDISGRADLLGILPALSDSPSGSDADTEDAIGAANRVHQIRVMLQVRGGSRDSAAYLVTSASAGEGKTSLAVSLGLSFAASGSRTLVIDADLVGQRLTRGLEATSLPGLFEALQSRTLHGCLRRTAAGLHVLTVGGAGAADACSVSAEAIKRLLADARRYFQTIVIDSGPLHGSVEASLLVQEVDGVIFTVSRGQQSPLVQRAIRHVDLLGGRLAGFVFNRAETHDFHSSAYGSSIRSASPATSSRSTAIQRRSRFGPLVEAVVTSLPGMQVGSLS